MTAQAPCIGCHAYINPFGFMQENYDAIGRYRTREEGRAIDANISVAFLDEGPFESSSPVDALRGFTRSFRFQQCFVRQLFRFYSGRDETAGDDPVLRQMFFDFATTTSKTSFNCCTPWRARPRSLSVRRSHEARYCTAPALATPRGPSGAVGSPAAI